MEDVIRSIPTQQRIPNSMHLRMVYRSLINRGRTYAAYTRDEGEYISRSTRHSPVLDPFSGFGLIHQYGAAAGTDTLGVEMNLPQVLWQQLVQPSPGSVGVRAIQLLRQSLEVIPEIRLSPCALDHYFSEEVLGAVATLYEWVASIIRTRMEIGESENTALSILLPFVGRFAAFSETSVAARTRKGGMILTRGWEEDFRLYLTALESRVSMSTRFNSRAQHRTLFADSRTVSFNDLDFGMVLTSPPYPNTQDYFTMFEPEHQVLHWLEGRGIIRIKPDTLPLIGQTRVKGSSVDSDAVDLTAVNNFFESVDRLTLTDRQKYDEDIYYRRYHRLYFHGLSKALSNVWSARARTVPGYIFVVDNTHRGVRIPVAESVAEIVRRIGAGAKVISLGEQFHVGTKNPRARGLRAKHERFLIEVNP